jgi:uncharacterized protein DUF6152
MNVVMPDKQHASRRLDIPLRCGSQDRVSIVAQCPNHPLLQSQGVAAECISTCEVIVKNSNGVVASWGCEAGNPGALSRRGWKRGDIKIGDTLIVDGFLAKDGSHLIDARRVTLPDGRTVYGGSPGDGGPEDSKTPSKP